MDTNLLHYLLIIPSSSIHLTSILSHSIPAFTHTSSFTYPAIAISTTS